MHDNLVRQESHAEVCLISPPFQFSKGPSLALGLLKAVLLREGITCHVDYADIYMLQALGLDCHRILNPGGMMDHLGEYIFCELAGIQPECSLEELTALYRKQGENPEAIELEKIIRSARQVAEEQTEATIQRILRYQPKIVGVTSCFQQRNAAIALCRKLKELRPDIVTVMGGANCFGRAGIAILREFPWVDYVFFGESDDIFAPVCRSILEGSDAPLPYGVLKNGDPLPQTAPHRIVMDLDSLPYPDYDEYYELLFSEVGEIVRCSAGRLKGFQEGLALFLETSRGCWWGEKGPCTFCGLHGSTRQFRSKSPQRAFDELRAVTEKYGVYNVLFTDCIMSLQWLDSFIPLLKACPVKFNMFQEIRSHYSADQIRRLAEAGYCALQPGIESLSDHQLKLMHKGVSMLQNLNFLKYGRSYGIQLSWNLIYGFPGEEPEDYYEQCRLIPLIEHFQAPVDCFRIVYARGNEYTSNPEAYGLSLTPSRIYRLSCPQKQDYIDDVAIYYDCWNPVAAPLQEAADALSQAARRWIMGPKDTRLDVADLGDKLLIIDTRRCRDLRAQYLVGAERDVYRLCASPVWLSRVQQQLSDQYDHAAVERAIRSLVAKKLLLHHGKYVFALTLPFSLQELKQREVWDFQLACRQNAELRQRAEEAICACSDSNSRQAAITQIARKLGMCFTGEDYERYALPESPTHSRVGDPPGSG